MVFNFNGKVALVTGGANGLGLAMVKKLLNNGIKNVLIVDVNPNGEQISNKLNPARVGFIKADVTNEAQLEAAFEKVIHKFGSLDIVINNAGHAIEENWENLIAINSVAVVRGTLLGMKYMGKDRGGKGGVIINIASVVGIRYLTSLPIYTATKHFVVSFGRSIGSPFFFSLTDVKVMTMCPGLTTTSINETACGLSGFTGIAEERSRQVHALQKQNVENVGKGLITMLNSQENGTVWVVESNEEAYIIEATTHIYT